MSFKIVKVSNHGCARVQKEAIPLLDRGHSVHLISSKFGSLTERYRTTVLYQDQDQLLEALTLFPHADIFHAHNEPSWYVSMIKSIFPDKPVVLDVHDSMLIRVHEDSDDPDAVRISVDERDNMQLADGLVFPSQRMADVCRQTFKLEQPYIVLPSYVSGGLYRFDAYKWLGGIVYEGRVDISEKLSGSAKFFSYCDYRDFAKQVHERGIEFFIFPASGSQASDLEKEYGDTAVIQEPKPLPSLIRALGSHNYGLVGNSSYHEDWQYAMPNKLFEYLAAGLPIIAINAGDCGKFIEENGYGMNITDMDDIPRRWSEHRKFRANIAKTRYEWCMENHIHKLEGLYRQLL